MESRKLDALLNFIRTTQMNCAYKLIILFVAIKLKDNNGKIEKDKLIDFFINFYKMRGQYKLKLDQKCNPLQNGNRNKIVFLMERNPIRILIENNILEMFEQFKIEILQIINKNEESLLRELKERIKNYYIENLQDPKEIIERILKEWEDKIYNSIKEGNLLEPKEIEQIDIKAAVIEQQKTEESRPGQLSTNQLYKEELQVKLNDIDALEVKQAEKSDFQVNQLQINQKKKKLNWFQSFVIKLKKILRKIFPFLIFRKEESKEIITGELEYQKVVKMEESLEEINELPEKSEVQTEEVKPVIEKASGFSEVVEPQAEEIIPVIEETNELPEMGEEKNKEKSSFVPRKRIFPTDKGKKVLNKIGTEPNLPQKGKLKLIKLHESRKKSTPKRSKKPIQPLTTKNLSKKMAINVPTSINISRLTSETIQTPYIEFNLNENYIELIIPKQQLNRNNENTNLNNIKLTINQDKIDQPLKKEFKEDTFEIQEIRIKIPSPLNYFKIPQFSKIFEYEHKNREIYIFTNRGNGIGRLEYDTTTLSIKNYIILVHEDWMPIIPIIEEIHQWIWEKFHPYIINLAKNRNLIIQNKKTQQEISFSTELSFELYGNNPQKDDLSLISPIFSKTSIFIKPLGNISDNLAVWIQQNNNKVHFDWNPYESDFEINTEKLPGKFGEFQLDIIGKGENFPLETQFFRWIPDLRISTLNTLLLPDCKQGYNEVKIKLTLLSQFRISSNCRIESEKNQNICNYSIFFAPKMDSEKIIITQVDNHDTKMVIQISIPKIRWRITGDLEWTDKIKVLNKSDLIPGKKNDLEIRINDFNDKYTIIGKLKNDLTTVEENFKQKGGYYLINLNRFYDDIARFPSDFILELEIYTDGDNSPKYLTVIAFKRNYRISQTVPEAILRDNFESLPLFSIYTTLNLIKNLIQENVPQNDILQIDEILKYYEIQYEAPSTTQIQSDNNKKLFALKSLKFLDQFLGENKPLILDESLYNSIKTIIYYFKIKYSSEFNS